MYLLIESETFSKSFEKRIPHGLKNDLQRRISKIALDPYALGKPLGYRFLRELKAGGFRIYYLIFDQEVVVLLVNVSDKKLQQNMIADIKHNRKYFEQYVREKRKLFID